MIWTKQNKKEYQGIGATEAFKYGNARSYFAAITDKNSNMSDYIQLSI